MQRKKNLSVLLYWVNSENAVVSAVIIIYGESVNHPKFSWTE